jgi:hypothetical protein
MTRVLVTGSREWDDPNTISDVFHRFNISRPKDQDVLIVHGAAEGCDTLAARVAEDEFGWATEPHPAADHPDPKARNLHMIGLGADVVFTFATHWASGTGHCAREARKAGLYVIDCGVDTHLSAKPLSWVRP